MLKSVAFVLLMGTLLSTPAGAQSVEEDVQAAYAAWNESFNSGDPAALAEAYTEDALLLPPTHTVMNGPAGVEEFFTGIFESGVTGHELELIEAGGEGSLVYAIANWSATAKGQDGAENQIGGIATHVFERQDDDSLKLKVHTFN